MLWVLIGVAFVFVASSGLALRSKIEADKTKLLYRNKAKTFSSAMEVLDQEKSELAQTIDKAANARAQIFFLDKWAVQERILRKKKQEFLESKALQNNALDVKSMRLMNEKKVITELNDYLDRKINDIRNKESELAFKQRELPNAMKRNVHQAIETSVPKIKEKLLDLLKKSERVKTEAHWYHINFQLTSRNSGLNMASDIYAQMAAIGLSKFEGSVSCYLSSKPIFVDEEEGELKLSPAFGHRIQSFSCIDFDTPYMNELLLNKFLVRNFNLSGFGSQGYILFVVEKKIVEKFDVDPKEVAQAVDVILDQLKNNWDPFKELEVLSESERTGLVKASLAQSKNPLNPYRYDNALPF